MRYRRENAPQEFKNILDKFGNNTECARQRRGLTTLELASKAGIDRTTLYYIEKGSSNVSILVASAKSEQGMSYTIY